MSIQQTADLSGLAEQWQAKWQEALALWSPYVRLHNPCFCTTEKEEKAEGLNNSFAMIRLTDLSVILSLQQINKYRLSAFALEIMAHEIGHHVYCPADLADLGRMLARIQRVLGSSCRRFSSLVGNLYSDLLINDRLFRSHGLKMDELYKTIREPNDDLLWNFYMRIYEILWSLPRGTLVTMKLTDEMEGDAQLGNRVIRHFADDWLKGAGRFAALCLTYLLKQKNKSAYKRMTVWMDTMQAGGGDTLPAGLTEIEEDEISGAIHPALDELGGEETEGEPAGEDQTGPGGNYREPYEYGQILQSLGIKMSPREVAIRYYRERAIPYLVPFPVEVLPVSTDPLPEGMETWEIGNPLEKINWIESVIHSPVIIPGITTLKRFYGTDQGTEPETEPVDLDLYVDCSGSMPDPTRNVSYLTLAAAIISISALRNGSRVQATLWSGTKQFITTEGFIRDEKKVLEIMTGYFGDGTAFPIHILRDTYSEMGEQNRKVHILVISDDGVTTMFNTDEKGNSGAKIAALALEKARGGGTFALNLYRSWKSDKLLVKAGKMGWDIYPISNWEDLLRFSREFTKKHYTKENKS